MLPFFCDMESHHWAIVSRRFEATCGLFSKGRNIRRYFFGIWTLTTRSSRDLAVMRHLTLLILRGKQQIYEGLNGGIIFK